MKKKIIALCLSFGFLFTTSFSVFAAETPLKNYATVTVTRQDGIESTVFINLNDCVVISLDDNGNVIPQPKVVLNRHTLSAHTTNLYFKNDGSTFNLYAGTKVSFSVNLAESATIEMGYRRGTLDSIVEKFTGTKHTITFDIPVTDTYAFTLHNRSSQNIIVTGGSINY